MRAVVTIETLGHRGDGVAQSVGGPVYVPFTLPGERVAVDLAGDRGKLVEVLEPSPQRAVPPCRHFGRCGGCALQMLPLPATRELKRDLLVTALARERLEAAVEATVGIPVASRRRAVLTALRAGKRLMLGYSERGSNRLVDIQECPILAPPLAAHVVRLRELLEPFVAAHEEVRVTATLTGGGLDLSLESARTPPPRALPALAAQARDHGIARISLDGEPFLTLAEPLVAVAGVGVVPPPGAFLQASAEAEAVMASLVADHLAGAKRAADLFAGLGAFTLRLARAAPVLAAESSQPALDALAAGLRRANGLKRIELERRDLFAFPLAARELARFDTVVFDPPRAGAKAQAEALALSRVERIAAVSCNPASFARDARTLVGGGYRLERVVPVDQFVFSAETEVVGLFRRA